MMTSSAGDFWDQRYCSEGAIWGEGASPTAELAARYAPAGARVLEIGFGYGRDLVFLAQRGFRVSGIELSPVGHGMAEARLLEANVQAGDLWLGDFQDLDLAWASYDVLVCHRMAHLLLCADAVARFSRKVGQVLRPGGLLCLGTRSRRDWDPAAMLLVGDQVYEYAQRPGHRIRYWDESSFHEVFAPEFTMLALTDAVEPETMAQPVACHLTIMAAQKHAPARTAVSSGALEVLSAAVAETRHE